MINLIEIVENEITYNSAKIFDKFNISRDFNISHEEAENLLIELLKKGIVKQVFIIICPECGRPFQTFEVGNIEKYPTECLKCDCEIEISKDDIYSGYIKNNS